MDKETLTIFRRIYRKIRWLKRFDTYSPYEARVEKIEEYVKQLEEKFNQEGRQL